MLTEKELYDCMAKSKTIVDIAYPGQESLSMRVLEALGAKIKLITDFKGIAEYDFYNPTNIYIIDAENIVMNDFFLDSSYTEVPGDYLKKYTVSAWVDDIFNRERRPKDFFK
jgi:hypothetical protein